jgi:hypothetical protein
LEHVADGPDWSPDDGVVLTRLDFERIFHDLRALIDGTGRLALPADGGESFGCVPLTERPVSETPPCGQAGK